MKVIGNKYGYWYEGSGGDANTNSKTFGPKSSYRGSWDNDGFNKEVKGFPYEFIYTLFANTEVNGQKKSITDPTLTIFDSILINQKKFSYFKDRKFTAEDLTKFMSSASEKNVDFIELSKQKATKENVNSFIDKGEELSWPKNWEEYPNNAGKLAYKANRARDEYLAKQESGVYGLNKFKSDAYSIKSSSCSVQYLMPSYVSVNVPTLISFLLALSIISDILLTTFLSQICPGIPND